MRTITQSFQTAPDLKFHSESIEVTLPFKIVSAYYGGGVEAGKLDAIMPYRAASIRGHLRWWWRATIGGRFTSADEMRKLESEIWGATDRASQISVEVLKPQAGTAVTAKRKEGERLVFEEPAYALFPAQSKEPHSIYKKGSFELRLRFPDSLGKDVDAALRHWITFGGIGARTRRGLGTLYTPSYSGMNQWINPLDFLGDGKAKNWPTLKGARIVWGKPVPWEKAWLDAVKVLQQYRQDRTGPRGRSYWEEPDAIRRLRGRHAPHHGQPMTTEDLFPRAAFGMPIIVHFKTPGDPDQNTIQVDKETDRMASPVILKAVALNEREAMPVMLALNVQGAPQKLLLKQDRAEDLVVSRGGYDVITGLLEKAAKDWNAKVYSL